MKKIFTIIFLNLFFFSFKIPDSVELHAMIDDNFHRVSYTFDPDKNILFSVKDVEDYTLTGNYENGNDDSGEYIEFNFKYKNNILLEKPIKEFYYFFFENDVLILIDKNKDFYCYSSSFIHLNARYKAGSVLIEYKNKPDLYNPQKLTSKFSLNDFWAEGLKGQGIGEKITVKFVYPLYDPETEDDTNVTIYGLIIFNGVFRNKNLYEQNSRIKSASVLLNNGTKINLAIKDTMQPQVILFNSNDVSSCTKLEFIIDSVYAGSKYEDTCITKLIFIGYYSNF